MQGLVKNMLYFEVVRLEENHILEDNHINVANSLVQNNVAFSVSLESFRKYFSQTSTIYQIVTFVCENLHHKVIPVRKESRSLNFPPKLQLQKICKRCSN